MYMALWDTVVGGRGCHVCMYKAVWDTVVGDSGCHYVELWICTCIRQSGILLLEVEATMYV